jgi:hypothetical protein
MGCAIAFCAQESYDSRPNYELAISNQYQTHNIDVQATPSSNQKE